MLPANFELDEMTFLAAKHSFKKGASEFEILRLLWRRISSGKAATLEGETLVGVIAQCLLAVSGNNKKSFLE